MWGRLVAAGAIGVGICVRIGGNDGGVGGGTHVTDLVEHGGESAEYGWLYDLGRECSRPVGSDLVQHGGELAEYDWFAISVKNVQDPSAVAAGNFVWRLHRLVLPNSKKRQVPKRENRSSFYLPFYSTNFRETADQIRIFI